MNIFIFLPVHLTGSTPCGAFEGFLVIFACFLHFEIINVYQDDSLIKNQVRFWYTLDKIKGGGSIDE
jgi:hypothetical protein